MCFLPKTELQRLIDTKDDVYVSTFLPTHRAGKATQQDPIRLKNLLNEAEEQLITYGLRGPEARRLLAKAYDLLDDAEFWQHQSDGLAIFMAPCLYKQYRLPLSFESLVVVSDAFHLKPILPLYSADGRFYLLAISQNEVRFMQATQYGVDEIELPNMPESMAATRRFDDPEKQLQYHTSAAPSRGGQPAMYHGHGAGEEDDEENLKTYFRQVANSVQSFLSQNDAPLVLAGVDSILSVYRAVNGYAYLVEEHVSGNPETLSTEALHQEAWQIIEPYFLKAQEEAISKFKQLAETNRASDDIRKIVPASYYGRVETLLVALGVQQWGTFDPATNAMNLHEESEPGHRDLLDAAAIQTLLKGGNVFAVPPENIPGTSPLVALFRYW